MDVFFLLLQESPGWNRLRSTAHENPNLLDNWDDAEGYYSKSNCPGLMDLHD